MIIVDLKDREGSLETGIPITPEEQELLDAKNTDSVILLRNVKTSDIPEYYHKYEAFSGIVGKYNVKETKAPVEEGGEPTVTEYHVLVLDHYTGAVADNGKLIDAKTYYNK